MTDTKILLLMFDGAPLRHFADAAEVREELSDVFGEFCDAYQVYELDSATETSNDITPTFVDEWSKAIDFGDGDDPEDFLKPFPDFVLAHRREALIAVYRAAGEQRDHERVERAKLNTI